MIAKHVAIKAGKTNDFARLVNYLTDAKNKLERVGVVRVTNCESAEAIFATTEVLNTQTQNKRARSDKTYHLLISFRRGEEPEDAVLKAIEERFCAGLGYAAHQRISVVHHDTNNLHMHIAINKIHPTRYTMHDPHADYKILGQLCATLENEFGLEPDSHRPNKRGAENLAADMEHHAGIESLLGWIRRECQAQIASAQSWEELHLVTGMNGLELHQRGNGLVFAADDGATVKASSVDRNFSKGALEARLGAFLPAPERQADGKAARRYEKKPISSGMNTGGLYARYLGEQASASGWRTDGCAKARERKDRLLKAAKRRGRMKRAALKLVRGSRPEKKALYALVSRALKNDVERITKQYFKEREVVYDKHRRRTWADWLRHRATEGDEEALRALRARDVSSALQGNTLSGRAAGKFQTGFPGRDSVTKHGTIIYRVGATAVRDDGDKLKVSRGATQEGLQAALQLAIARYGANLRVEGSDAFKDQIVRAAVAAKLEVRFDVADLEQRRHDLMQQTKIKEQEHERADRGRTAGRGLVRSGAAAAGNAGPAAARPASAGRAAGRAARSDIGGLGKEPPPASRHRLRGLSELGVVHIASGASLLLPRHVPGHVEQQGAAAADGVRRGLPGLAPESASAADKYVFEREQKRCNGFDIPKHKRYDGSDGLAAFAGIRQVDGAFLALVRREQEIMVMPVDEASARRLKRLRLGQEVTVAPGGGIKKKGRRR
jgi:hypothetical protein